MTVACTLFAASVTPYQQAKRASANGYFDVKLQDGLYEVFFNGNDSTSARRANDFALLRASEVCLENGYQSFQIVRKTENFTEKEIDTGIRLFGGKLRNLENSEPKISLIIRCSANANLLYQAQELKNNLQERYQLKESVPA